ncbi:unnamed protein product [Caenorhabditis bovis]|uniref:Uncharacterized protein n=1 Tax=Caenorhabditis bovis TaxID=2654633 RepID=A0A8S1EMA6_9PELO|nr:unnamed protein product [Caenorhabditis bovis]
MLYFVNFIIILMRLQLADMQITKCVACIDPVFNFIDVKQRRDSPLIVFPKRKGLLPCEQTANPEMVECHHACFKASYQLTIDYPNGTYYRKLVIIMTAVHMSTGIVMNTI